MMRPRVQLDISRAGWSLRDSLVDEIRQAKTTHAIEFLIARLFKLIAAGDIDDEWGYLLIEAHKERLITRRMIENQKAG